MRPAPPSPPFDARTSYNDDYAPKQLPTREYAAPQQWHPSPGEFYATTEYGEKFQGWEMPAHRPGLGISLVDGSFYGLIPGGWEAPNRASVIVTSVTLDQETANIQVLQGSCPVAAQDTPLGNFSVALPPGPVGHAKVEVVFVIDANCTLNVAAREMHTGEHAAIVIGSDAVSPAK